MPRNVCDFISLEVYGVGVDDDYDFIDVPVNSTAAEFFALYGVRAESREHLWDFGTLKGAVEVAERYELPIYYYGE